MKNTEMISKANIRGYSKVFILAVWLVAQRDGDVHVRYGKENVAACKSSQQDKTLIKKVSSGDQGSTSEKSVSLDQLIKYERAAHNIFPL